MAIPDNAIPQALPRVDLLRGLARVLISATVVVVAYFALPLDRLNAAGSVITMVLVVLLFTYIGVLEVRSIATAKYPGLRALVALGVLVPLFLVIVATAYYLLGLDDPGSFSETMSRLDALYFAVTVFATVGFGDITAVSSEARIVTTIQMVSNLVVIGVGLRVILGAVSLGRRREHLPDA